MDALQLLLALIGHLVGDYLLQNDWMANNKKERSFPCLVHAGIWALCVVLFAGWGWQAGLALGICHFVQDRTYLVKGWIRLMGQEGFASGPCAPWSVIVVDNVWHVLQILVVGKTRG